MKIEISVEAKKITMELSPENVRLIFDTALEMLQEEITMTSQPEDTRHDELQEQIFKALPEEPETDQPEEIPEEDDPDDDPGWIPSKYRKIRPPELYKGFLLIECESCGAIKGRCVRQQTDTWKCACGAQTKLHGLKPLYTNCSCGRQFKYMTNIKKPTHTMTCLECGYSVRVRINREGTAYVPA